MNGLIISSVEGHSVKRIPAATADTDEIEIGEFHCSQCAVTVGVALRGCEGVVEAVVLPGARRLRVRFDPALVSPADVVSAARAGER